MEKRDIGSDLHHRRTNDLSFCSDAFVLHSTALWRARSRIADHEERWRSGRFAETTSSIVRADDHKTRTDEGARWFAARVISSK